MAMGSVSGSESQRNNAIPGRVQVKVTTEEDTKRVEMYVDLGTTEKIRLTNFSSDGKYVL
jgi:hypothetical protein